MSAPSDRAGELTEADWFARLNPRRIPKLFARRLTRRKSCLLGCAYTLHPEGVLRNPTVRRMVETVRAAAFHLPLGHAFGTSVSAALVREFPQYFTPSCDFWALRDRAELQPDLFLVLHLLPSLVNGSARPHMNLVDWCLSTIKRAAEGRVRESLAEVARAHGVGGSTGLWGALKAAVGWSSQTTYHEAVLALIPEDKRDKARTIPWYGTRVPTGVLRQIDACEKRKHCAVASAAMLRLAADILGSPFHRPHIERDWLAWNHGAVSHIAEQIAATGNFADLPILADALEDAGCTDEFLLHHCREGHVHVPGCWALDAVLGRT
jgi:hypothetical protein